MLLSKGDVQGDAAAGTFYGPISKYGYLTPEQRKKLREIRNLKGSHSEESTNLQSQPSKTKNSVEKSEKTNLQSQPVKTKNYVKKSEKKIHSKSKRKVQTRESVYKKNVKSNIPQIRFTAAQLIDTKKNDTVTKKFFKNRSPDHFKKANFVLRLVNKRNRLDFTSAKNDDSYNAHSISNSSCSQDISEKGDDLESSKTVERYVLPVQKNDQSSSELLPASTDKSEECPKNLLFDIQQSFTEIFDVPESVSKSDCEESYGSELLDSGIDSNTSKESETPKFYPIFYVQKAKNAKSESTGESTVMKKAFCIKDTSKGSEQMIIDAGQKEIGAKQCKTCNMIYFIGQEEDEKLHSEYHDMYLVNLRFPGWKNENVVGHFEDGRVIRVTKDDKKNLKKLQDVLLIANRDLGFSTTKLPERPNLIFLLFISNDKKVKGCLVAESITSASPIVLDETFHSKNKQESEKVIWEFGSWYASSTTVPAVCGINRIWVAKDYRRHKVASRLIDCLRYCFIFGHVVSMEELAFTDPTPDGRNFASRYTGTDNFLVYK